MKIINTVTGETVAEILTNHSMSLDEAINLVGEIYPQNEDENVEINGAWYYYDDLAMDWSEDAEENTNKKFYAETNADKVLVVVSTDDPAVAAWFNVNGIDDALATDTSNIDGMTAEQIRAEYPAHVFTFDPASPDWERIEEI